MMDWSGYKFHSEKPHLKGTDGKVWLSRVIWSKPSKDIEYWNYLKLHFIYCLLYRSFYMSCVLPKGPVKNLNIKLNI